MSPQGSLFQNQLPSMATLFFLLPLIASVSATVPIPAPTINPPDFISKSCSSTALRDLCIKTFAPFLNTVKDNKVQIAEIAINVSLTAAIGMDAYMTKVLPSVNTSKPPLDPRVVEAITYCAKMHKDAILQLNGSVAILSNYNMKKYGPEGEPNGDLDDADMNVALAQSNMGECLAQWKNITDGPQKTDICVKTQQVQDLVNIGRALLTTLERVVQRKENTPPPANCPVCVCCPGQKVAAGQCCKCCNAPALPSMEVSKAELVENMCSPGDEHCKEWVMKSN